MQYEKTNKIHRDYGLHANESTHSEMGPVTPCDKTQYTLAHVGVCVTVQRIQVDYKVISATCNMFRALTDMYDSFYSVQSMIDYFARDNYNMSAYSRPGAWNDPDQVT